MLINRHVICVHILHSLGTKLVLMSLGTRLTLKTAVLILAVLVVAAAAVVGLNGLNRDLDAALIQYERMRAAYTLLSDIDQARAYVRNPEMTQQQVEQALLRPMLKLQRRELGGVLDPALKAELKNSLDLALAGSDAEDLETQQLAIIAPLNSAINRLAAEVDDTAARIKAIDARAKQQRRRVMLWVSITASLAAALAVFVGVWQYLTVMNPLRRLQQGVKRLASGEFSETLAVSGDREFVALAEDFNRMADELATLYNELEQKVRERSAQLAQSERLASVGFLAAGVAHEINNPLAIIAGEAELALAGLPADADDDLRKGLSTTRDEAFRCKAITQKLLSLARPGSGQREPVDLSSLAKEVAELVRSLPQHKSRRVTFNADGTVLAQTDASQVKQVLLNLVINALEAVAPDSGKVEIIVRQLPGAARIVVKDNGRGMGLETLERVFEPFYTEKKSPTTPGLGLGLSISHAIIEDLGGKLSATSDGEGRGSAFKIELPVHEGDITD